jgi:uncharacterized protein (DUF1684 family)
MIDEVLVAELDSVHRMRRDDTRMMSRATALAGILAIGACTSGPPPPPTADTRPYAAEIAADRVAKDEFFRLSSDSPLLPADRAGFAGLPYYAVDAAYRVPASLTPDPTGGDTIIRLPTSQDTFDQMRKVGSLGFVVAGRSFTLTAFASVNDRTIDRLFVPFRDATSNDETYGGGRYLDLDRTPTGLYDLDFNRAYHPYCVFNVSYICPLPPDENRLDIAIRAGERLAANGDPGTAADGR